MFVPKSCKGTFFGGGDADGGLLQPPAPWSLGASHGAQGCVRLSANRDDKQAGPVGDSRHFKIRKN